MRSFKVALIALGILLPGADSEAAPQLETFKTIGIIGLNTTNGFVGVNSPGDSQACTFGLINFDPTTATGSILYASLLSAKSGNRTVTISYERVGASCTLTQVAVF